MYSAKENEWNDLSQPWLAMPRESDGRTVMVGMLEDANAC
jgi:hypothetical protein